MKGTVDKLLNFMKLTEDEEYDEEYEEYEDEEEEEPEKVGFSFFKKKEKEPVDNSDRHLCKTCKFRSNRPTVNSCDYAGLMNHSRGCKVEECTKYEKGARMKMKDVEE